MGKKKKPKTHDYTIRTWGHNVNWSVKDEVTLSANGWGTGIRAGDYLLLPNGDRSTRYEVREIRYMRDPRDQWFAELVFAPR